MNEFPTLKMSVEQIAALNMSNGSWKRSQQCASFLRKLSLQAMFDGEEKASELLNAAADEIALGGVLP